MPNGVGVRAGVILVPRRPPGLAGFSLLVVAGFASRPPPWRFLLGGSSFARVVELGRHTTLKMWRPGGVRVRVPPRVLVC